MYVYKTKRNLENRGSSTEIGKWDRAGTEKLLTAAICLLISIVNEVCKSTEIPKLGNSSLCVHLDLAGKVFIQHCRIIK